MSTNRQLGSLSTHLMVAQIGVAVAMALTMIVVASLAGPPLFEAHMYQTGDNSPDVLAHSEEAFATAGTLALGIGLTIATTAAIVLSVLISRRLRRSLDDLGAATSRISDGDYDLRIVRADSRELATLADSFNTMAGRLADVEATRRRLLTDLAHAEKHQRVLVTGPNGRATHYSYDLRGQIKTQSTHNLTTKYSFSKI